MSERTGRRGRPREGVSWMGKKDAKTQRQQRRDEREATTVNASQFVNGKRDFVYLDLRKGADFDAQFTQLLGSVIRVQPSNLTVETRAGNYASAVAVLLGDYDMGLLEEEMVVQILRSHESAAGCFEATVFRQRFIPAFKQACEQAGLRFGCARMADGGSMRFVADPERCGGTLINNW